MSLNGGVGVFGIEAAARHYFGVSAADLSDSQAAWLASILPAPKRADRKRDAPWIAQKAEVIPGAYAGRWQYPDSLVVGAVAQFTSTSHRIDITKRIATDMNQLTSSKSSGLWPNCGYGQLSINDQNQLLVTDAFLTHLIRPARADSGRHLLSDRAACL